MGRHVVLVMVFGVLFLTGCGPDARMKHLVGLPKSELLAEWGPPQNRMADGSGGEVWTYYEDRQWVTPGESNTTAYVNGNYGAARTVTTPATVQGYSARRTFFIDRYGVVYRYAWQGL